MKSFFFMGSLILGLSFILTPLFSQHRGGGRGGNPPFVEACNSLSEGDQCSFQRRDGSTITGVCTKKKNPRTNQSELICWNESAMKRMGPPPRRQED